LAHRLFGNEAFVLDKGEGKTQSRPLFDGIMVALDRLWAQRHELVDARIDLAERLEKLLRQRKTYEIMIGKPNTANAVRARIAMIEKSFRLAIR
jgi:hypothetical protein